MTQQANTLMDVTSPHFGIHRVYVQDLFGRYTYDLISDANEPTTSQRMLLYGDNGSGKTTLLRLIVNLLSHVDNKGHKGSVADVKFKYFLIGIGALRVEAARDRFDDHGFTARVSNESRLIAEAVYFMNEDKESEENKLQRKKLLKALEEINIGLFFLADDRRVTSNVLVEIDEPDSDEVSWSEAVRHSQIIYRETRANKRKTADKVLEAAVARVSSWATTKTLKASTQGEDDVNSIYSRIIQQLARRSGQKAPKSTPNVDALVRAMQEQYDRSLGFSQFGLTSPPKIDKLLALGVERPEGSS
jgi:energy-coupling factor transporter ATP-binding protein EcfA2